MAAADDLTVAPPTLVNNVETLANVPGILARGADWFRSAGTSESPGTFVATVAGDTVRAGVGEYPMGTPLRRVIEEVGGGVSAGHSVLGVLPGVANAMLPGDRLDAPASYEGMRAAGSGLGAGGFLVFDDGADPVAVAQGVARFLAVESCGQCTPCKGDGLAVAERLDAVRASDAGPHDVRAVEQWLATITEGARCYLAHQHQQVVESVLRLFPEAVRAHVDGAVPAAPPVLIAPLLDIDGFTAVIDDEWARKQPDWSYDGRWSGDWPTQEVDVRSGAGH